MYLLVVCASGKHLLVSGAHFVVWVSLGKSLVSEFLIQSPPKQCAHILAIRRPDCHLEADGLQYEQLL